MNTIKDNAKDFLSGKLKFFRRKSSNIIIKFTDNTFVIYIGKSFRKNAFEAHFDSDYFSGDGMLDSRYFSRLFLRVFKDFKIKSKFFHISILLSSKWILQYNFNHRPYEDHQLEREIILYFQNTHFININEYEFLINREDQLAAAVKKSLLQSFQSCFNWPVNFILENKENFYEQNTICERA